jgi:DNA invertase Pin-like site-specific DNA recombinase
MKIGYARVSTADQNPQLQLDALLSAGCEKLFVDKASGADRERPELAKALKFMQEGDVFVVWKLDRLARSSLHLLELMKELDWRNVKFLSLTDSGIDTSTASGKLLFQVLAALAEFERNLIRERTIAGLTVARREGRIGGRAPKLSGDQVKDAIAKRKLGLTVPELCETYGVCRATLYRSMGLVQGSRPGAQQGSRPRAWDGSRPRAQNGK